MPNFCSIAMEGCKLDSMGSSEPDADMSQSRYRRDLQEDRKAVREALRASVFGAHIGLGATLIALIVIVSLSEPFWALVVAGSFAAWFLLALAVILIGGGRGRDAFRRAYVATFGWGDFITP